MEDPVVHAVQKGNTVLISSPSTRLLLQCFLIHEDAHVSFIYGAFDVSKYVKDKPLHLQSSKDLNVQLSVQRISQHIETAQAPEQRQQRSILASEWSQNQHVFHS